MFLQTPTAQPTDRLPILTFRLGEQVYALLISEVVEVEAMVERIPVLNAPPEILGLVNRHGTILPLLDLRIVFNQPAAPVTSASFFIVAAYHQQEIGLVVDTVLQVDYVNSIQLENASASGEYIRGIISSRMELIPVIALEPLIATFLANRQSG
jgi:purine-binding chemotaxis protein CheW